MAAYDNLRLEKGMYQVAGKSFTQVLEELDPSQQYRGTPLEGLDAYQRRSNALTSRSAAGTATAWRSSLPPPPPPPCSRNM